MNLPPRRKDTKMGESCLADKLTSWLFSSSWADLKNVGRSLEFTVDLVLEAAPV